MNIIIIISFVYLCVIFSFVYLLSIAKAKRMQSNITIKRSDGSVSPSVAIVDSIGGENNAMPIKDFLDFVSECRLQSPYIVKGAINE